MKIAPFFSFVTLRLSSVQAFLFKQERAVFLGQPQQEDGADAIVLFVAAEFVHQQYHKDNWQSDQSQHEEKSKAHHSICLLSCFI